MVTQSRVTPASQDKGLISERLPIFIDRSRAPLIRITAAGEITDADFLKYLADSDDLMAAGRRHGTLFEAFGPFEMTPKHRKWQAEWVRDNADALRKLCVGAAFAFDSPITRGALTAITWLVQMPIEVKVVKNATEGQVWLEARLRKTRA